MIEHDFDTAHSILYVRPKSALTADDFAKIASTVDPHIEAADGLAGIVIETPSFPGWEGLGAMAAHFRFVRDHHRRVKKVAVVTDSALGSKVGVSGTRAYDAGEAWWRWNSCFWKMQNETLEIRHVSAVNV